MHQRVPSEGWVDSSVRVVVGLSWKMSVMLLLRDVSRVLRVDSSDMCPALKLMIVVICDVVFSVHLVWMYVGPVVCVSMLSFSFFCFALCFDLC